MLIQRDMKIYLDTSDPFFTLLHDTLVHFTEIEKSFSTIYIYRLTKISIWSALAQGYTLDKILFFLESHGAGEYILSSIQSWAKVYGQITLIPESESYLKVVTFRKDLDTLLKNIPLEKVEGGYKSPLVYRGVIKSQLMQNDLPVIDRLPYQKGVPLSFSLSESVYLDPRSSYQIPAAQAIHMGGSGIDISACGSGKTIIGLHTMALRQTSTLIVSLSKTSLKQWQKTLLSLTTLTPDQVQIYKAKDTSLAPVTLITYNMLSYKRDGHFPHLEKVLKSGNFGLIIYDEIHLLPSDLFQMSSSCPSILSLGLTATFVREDGRVRDLFSLIGPIRFNTPWKDLESRGYISKVSLYEVQIPLDADDSQKYIHSIGLRNKYLVSAQAMSKIPYIKALLNKHRGKKILIIGQYTKQLKEISRVLGIAYVSGSTPLVERERIYDQMRSGERDVLMASKIATAALDIPAMSIVIQVSFQQGSRNEEAQRVGRLTRPKDEMAYFYTLVCKDTIESSYNLNRQKFLVAEGYRYEKIAGEVLLSQL